MYVPKKSKYLHLSGHAYRGRKPLSYYVGFEGKSAPYLLLEILNTTVFPENEIISFCEKCKVRGLGILDISEALYKACDDRNNDHRAAAHKFVTKIMLKWNSTAAKECVK